MEDINIAIGRTKNPFKVNHLMFYFGSVSKESKCIPSTPSLEVEIVLRFQIADCSGSYIFYFVSILSLDGRVRGRKRLIEDIHPPGHFMANPPNLKIDSYGWGSFLWTDRLVK